MCEARDAGRMLSATYDGLLAFPNVGRVTLAKEDRIQTERRTIDTDGAIRIEARAQQNQQERKKLRELRRSRL